MNADVEKAVEVLDATSKRFTGPHFMVMKLTESKEAWQTIRQALRDQEAEIAQLTHALCSEQDAYRKLTDRCKKDEADAVRWRASHFADAPLVTVTGAQLAKGIRPGDYAVPWDWPINAKTKVRLIAMKSRITAHLGAEQ